MPKRLKGFSQKKVTDAIWSEEGWLVKPGRLAKGRGRPPKTDHLFKYVAEKLPFASLNEVRKEILKNEKESPQGVYLAHDSMGFARYGGRGDIFNRLATHKREYSKELQFFSFYVIANKAHERDIETVILRAAGPQMTLNTKKNVASGLHPGNIADYEPGTHFFERQNMRGRKAKTCKKKNSN